MRWREAGAVSLPALVNLFPILIMPKLIVVAALLVGSIGLAAQRPAVECKSVGSIRFICGVTSPEDLAVIPGGQWVVASGDREGGRLHLVDVRNKTATVAFPTVRPTEQLDRTTYPTCPGPIRPTEGNEFRAHGMYLKPAPDGVHALHVVHHGLRESIEVFRLDARKSPPTFTWVGCAIAPQGAVLNAVVALPEGGFATSN